jgi:hypothetical protein
MMMKVMLDENLEEEREKATRGGEECMGTARPKEKERVRWAVLSSLTLLML